MLRSNLTGSENRLLRYTLAQIQEQQKAAGTTISGVAPVNVRAAQTASALQNSAPKGITVGSNPNADLVERMVQVNFDPSKATPDEIARQEAGMKLAQGDQYVAAPGTNPAKGVVTAQQQTYQNKSAGLNTTYNQESGVTSASGDGALQQAAIDRLRAAGKTDAEITTLMSQPEFMQNIQTTMSNTGLGGTERQSAVLTPAQAQAVLANSRNPKERAEAQKVIDGLVSGVKGYVPRTQTDSQGNTITTFSEDPQATETEQRRERERLALEEANRLKSQENADKLKKFTAGIDTTQLDQTKTQLDTLMAQIQNLSPDLQAAVLPSLISLQNSNNEITKQMNDMISAQPTDAEIESQYSSIEDYITDQDTKYKALLEKNLETAKEVATYNRDTLEIEKKIIDHDAAIAEQKQMAANVDGEKKLRRQLNRLGIQTDVSGLTFLQSEIQKGVDALESLKTSNNLVSLKAQLAIGEGYRLEVKQAMEAYEGKYLDITSQTTEKLQSIKNSISSAKSDRTKAIIDAKKWGLEQKQENDKDLRSMLADANKTMNDNMFKLADDQRAQEQLGWTVLDKAIDDYGTNIPQSILDRVGRMIPGVDLQDIATAKTLAQLKKLGGGGGGGGSYGFAPGMYNQSTGAPPTFDSYVAAKEQQAVANGAMVFDTSPKAMAQYRKEWEAKYSQITDLNPVEIQKRFDRKAGTLSGPNRKYAQQLFNEAMANKDYAYAAQIADDTGDDVDATSSAQFTNALATRVTVNKMSNLIKEFGTMGPATGRLRNLDPYDDKAVQFKRYVTEVVPGLARGIFLEVGVLTDDDVARYTNTVGNPNLTVGQATQAFDDLKEIIDQRMKAQIDVWDANRKSVGGFRQLYNQQPLNVAENVDDPSALDTFIPQ